jgi:hypothetical protein
MEKSKEGKKMVRVIAFKKMVIDMKVIGRTIKKKEKVLIILLKKEIYIRVIF